MADPAKIVTFQYALARPRRGHPDTVVNDFVSVLELPTLHYEAILENQLARIKVELRGKPVLALLQNVRALLLLGMRGLF